MSETSRTIVVGVDGAEFGLLAVRWAAQVASQRGFQLEIVHTVRSPRPAYGDIMMGSTELADAVRDDGRQVIEDAVAAARSIDGKLEVRTVMPTDSPTENLIRRSHSARMVVVGCRGANAFTAMLLGSTAAAVLSHAECPVAVIRGRAESAEFIPDGPVVVGIDGSPVSERALEVAFEEASVRAMPLVVVHAWSDVAYDELGGLARLAVNWESIEGAERRYLAERLAGWGEKYPDVEVRRVLVRDRPRHALLEWSAKAQLVVVGSRGRGGFLGLLLGSTSQALAQHAKCPVLVVRPSKNP
ncbi:universal stress protein [Amycolatopsis sp. H20-H5]|uniref:universal stress protein n=1 Tax=Amycolatopsis sp. H20-H5 TaxID=3046309 RepID=UPI002DB82C79|nr:universal stress protein [Amycolatopsis sp. H20-H5]MEC3981673.1 universal stress protein [Amycolatopsis sp. H20-H5]